MKYCRVLLIIIVIFLLFSIIMGYIFPFEMVNVECIEILPQDYVNNYTNTIPDEYINKVLNEPEKYLLFNFSVHIKNNTSKVLHIENYSLKIPGYKMIYWVNGTEFYSYYEYMPQESSMCFGQAILYVDNENKHIVLKKITELIKIKLYYWVYLNDTVLPFFAIRSCIQ